jgi:hypothetical protein
MSAAAHTVTSVLAFFIAGCSQPADRSAAPPETPPARNGVTDAMPQHPLTPEPERTFVDGPPIDPPDALLEWLETTASADPRPRIRLPVVVRFRDQHRLGLDGGHIGVSPAALPGVIGVTLDDSAMGISLLDRVRDACPDSKETVCPVWLEGTWAGGPSHKMRVFRLVGVNPPAPPAGGAPIRALIESNPR